jgi:lysozyme
MKLCLVLVAITCLVGGLNAQTCSSSSCPVGYTCHVVQSGDTVSALVGGSTSCINSVYSVYAPYPYSQYNYNANLIYPGEVLCIPTGCFGYNYNSYTNYAVGQSTTCANGYSCASGSCYTVQPGQTVSGIVGSNQNCINAVASANGLSNVNAIYAGQSICIPSSAYGCNSYAAAYNTYGTNNYYTYNNGFCPSGSVVTVQPSQTVSGLVGNNQNCINAVATANGLSNVNLISVGQTLCLPYGCTGYSTYNNVVCGRTYIVTAGDICSTIAARLGTTVAQLYSCNPVINNQYSATPCSNLQVGQTITY